MDFATLPRPSTLRGPSVFKRLSCLQQPTKGISAPLCDARASLVQRITRAESIQAVS